MYEKDFTQDLFPENFTQDLFPKRTFINSNEHRDTWEDGHWSEYKRKQGMALMKDRNGVIKRCKSWGWELTSSSKPRPPMQSPPKHLLAQTPSNIVVSPGEALPESGCDKTDPKAVLASIKWPENINEWGMLQKIIWRGHPRLPQGWIRIWSKTQGKEYYLRLKDKMSTFNFDELSENRKGIFTEKDTKPKPPVEPPPIHLLPTMMVCPYCKRMSVVPREVATNFCSSCGKDIKGS